MSGKTVFGAEIPFINHCAIEEVGFAGDRTRLLMKVGPEHLNNLGIVHGGALCTLLDVAMGTVCRTQAGVPVMTLDMQIAFLTPGRGPLIGEGRVLKAGRSIIFAEASIFDEAGELVAKASGTFKPVRRPEPSAS